MTYRVLNRCLGIDSVLVIEVNIVHTQALQATLDCLPNVLKSAVDAAGIWMGGIAHDAELRGEEHLISFCLNRSPDELLVRMRPVHIRCVEEVDAKAQRAM